MIFFIFYTLILRFLPKQIFSFDLSHINSRQCKRRYILLKYCGTPKILFCLFLFCKRTISCLCFAISSCFLRADSNSITVNSRKLSFQPFSVYQILIIRSCSADRKEFSCEFDLRKPLDKHLVIGEHIESARVQDYPNLGSLSDHCCAFLSRLNK